MSFKNTFSVTFESDEKLGSGEIDAIGSAIEMGIQSANEYGTLTPDDSSACVELVSIKPPPEEQIHVLYRYRVYHPDGLSEGRNFLCVFDASKFSKKAWSDIMCSKEMVFGSLGVVEKGLSFVEFEGGRKVEFISGRRLSQSQFDAYSNVLSVYSY